MPGAVEELIERLWPGRVERVEQLTNGITNSNYLVDLGDDRVVVRVPGKDTALLGIDRRHEVEAGRLAASVGVGPDVILHDEATNCIVTRFIEARQVSPEELAGEPILDDFVAALRKVHAAGTVDAVFDPYRVVRAYRDEAGARGVTAPFDLGSALALMDRIEARPPIPHHRAGAQRPAQRQLPLRRHGAPRRLGVRRDDRPVLRPGQRRGQQRLLARRRARAARRLRRSRRRGPRGDAGADEDGLGAARGDVGRAPAGHLGPGRGLRASTRRTARRDSTPSSRPPAWTSSSPRPRPCATSRREPASSSGRRAARRRLRRPRRCRRPPR